MHQMTIWVLDCISDSRTHIIQYHDSILNHLNQLKAHVKVREEPTTVQYVNHVEINPTTRHTTSGLQDHQHGQRPSGLDIMICCNYFFRVYVTVLYCHKFGFIF